MDSPDTFAVLPILPAAHSLAVVLILCASGVIGGLWALRHPQAWGVLLRVLWSQKWSLLTLFAAGWLGVAAFGLLTRTPERNDGAEVLVGGEWSHRGGHRRHGSVVGSSAPVDGTIQWVGGVGHTFFASAAVVGDRVYNVGFQGNRGRLFCWNAHTGRQLWTSSLEGLRATFSSPVIIGHRLLIGEGLHHTPDASVFCVDLRSGREGEILWRFTTNSHVECTPLLVDETVYIAAGNDGVYALSLDPNDGGETVVRWHVPGERAPDVETAMCYHNGRLIVGLGKDGTSPGQALLVLDAVTGNERARIPMPFPVHGIPSVSNGRLYVGMGSGDYVHHQQTSGQVVCIDLATFETRWSHSTKGTVLGAIVSDDAGLLCGCTAGHVYAINHDSELLHTWNGHSPILASTALADETVLTVNQAGVLTALDRNDLKVRWETRLGEPGQYISSPVVAHGHAYLGTATAGFLCVGTSGRGDEGTSTNGGELPARGQVLWQYAVSGDITAAPVVTGSTIAVPSVTAEGPVLIGLSNGGSEPPRPLWTRPVDTRVTQSLVASGEVLVVATENRLLAIDAPTGRILWDVTAAVRRPPVIRDNLVWISTGEVPSNLWRSVSLLNGQPEGVGAIDNFLSPTDPKSALSVSDCHLLLQTGTDESPVEWCDLSSVGDVVAEPTVAAGRAYIALSGGRLACVGGTEAE